MPSVAELDEQLNDMILQGQIIDAFERFYAEDVVMWENDQPFRGKETNRKREQELVDSADFHNVEILSRAVNDDVTFTEWLLDFTKKGVGRMERREVGVRRWKNGQIAEERFYYKGA